MMSKISNLINMNKSFFGKIIEIRTDNQDQFQHQEDQFLHHENR